MSPLMPYLPSAHALSGTFREAALAEAAAAGEEFELFIGKFNVLLIGELHDLINVFAVFELFLLFIAQLSEDSFQ